MRIVDLHDRDALLAQQFHLAPQDRHARLDEVLARRIRLRRALGVPHPLAQQRRRRKRRLDLPRSVSCLEELDLSGDESGLLGRELVDHDRPRPAVGRVAAQLEAVGQLGDDADVALAPPLAVGDDVEPGALLQRDGGADGGFHQPAIVSVRCPRSRRRSESLTKPAAAASRRPTWERATCRPWARSLKSGGRNRKESCSLNAIGVGRTSAPDYCMRLYTGRSSGPQCLLANSKSCCVSTSMYPPRYRRAPGELPLRSCPGGVG